MKVLLTTIAARTHLYSMVPLAWALKSAGHEVRFAVQPSVVDHVTGAGLAAAAVGYDVHMEFPSQRETETRPFTNVDFSEFNTDEVETTDLLAMLTVMVPTYFSGANEGLVSGLVDFAREWRPELVIWEPLTWAGAIAARGCGARHARLLWGPDVIGDAMLRFDKRMTELPVAHREDPLREWFGWTADTVGVDVEKMDIYGEWTIEVEASMFRLETELETMEAGYVPYNGPALFPEWLARNPGDSEGDRPMVCLTLGISAREGKSSDAVNLSALVFGLRDFDADFVVTMESEQAQAIGAPPANVRIVDYVALDLLLPFCAAIVHHGGAGTWATALHHGVPQIILGHTWDAPLKADWLDAAGAGISMSPSDPTDKILAALRRLLDTPSYRERALDLSRQARSVSTPAQAVRELEVRVESPPA